MQPIAVISSPAAGIAYINGRFAGELNTNSPLVLPISPHGTLYLEFRPFARRWRCSAHRFSFAGGAFDPESAADGCRVIIWPGNIYEISLTPLTAVPAESEYTVIDGIAVAILRGEASLLRLGSSSVALPDGAALPHSHINTNGASLWLGKYPEGEYAAVFSAADLSPVDVLTATNIAFDDSQLHALTHLDDVAGHARADIFSLTAGGLETITSEYLWADGAAKPPASAADTMLAVLEAALLGLMGEANSYLAPELRENSPLASIIDGYDAAMPLRYAPPDARSGAALIKRLSANVARAYAVRFHARPDGGIQSLWLIDSIEK